MTNEEFIKSISLEDEIWKDVVGYEGLYKVSNFGRIFICSNRFKFRNGGEVEKGLKIKKTYLDKDGYERTSLYKNKKSKTITVHRVVAYTFIENPNNFPCIDHIDGNRQNNVTSNLRWCTNKMNANYELALKNRSKSQKLSYKKGRKLCHWIEKRNNERKIKIYVYSLKGDFLKECDSISDASRYVNGRAFSGLVDDKPFYCKGYILSINKITDSSIFPYTSPTSKKNVLKLDLSNNVITEYHSIQQAVKMENISIYKIRDALYRNKEIAGFRFKFKYK